MSGGEDLGIDPGSLKQITEGLRGAIGELKGVASETDAVMGAGFQELKLTGMEAGHKGLGDDFEDFCERWEWGVRALIQDANELASRVGLSAGMMWEQEQYVNGTLKVAANSLAGNPHLSEDEVEKADWGELFSADTYRPDYSGESFQRALDESRQTWQDTGRTITSEGRIGRLTDLTMDAAGIDEQTREQARDRAFGPSPEERGGT
ncbi:hypothetical protein GCM10027168_16670 [Streptomyces capparidis]